MADSIKISELTEIQSNNLANFEQNELIVNDLRVPDAVTSRVSVGGFVNWMTSQQLFFSDKITIFIADIEILEVDRLSVKFDLEIESTATVSGLKIGHLQDVDISPSNPMADDGSILVYDQSSTTWNPSRTISVDEIDVDSLIRLKPGGSIQGVELDDLDNVSANLALDGHILVYNRQRGEWIATSNNNVGIPEAPIDGVIYARQDAKWVRLDSLVPGFVIGNVFIIRNDNMFSAFCDGNIVGPNLTYQWTVLGGNYDISDPTLVHTTIDLYDDVLYKVVCTVSSIFGSSVTGEVPAREGFGLVHEGNDGNVSPQIDETPVVIDGYYPLYTTLEAANAAGNGTSHNHIFDDVEYYMPNGIPFWHGNYAQPAPSPTPTPSPAPAPVAPAPAPVPTPTPTPAPAPGYY